MYSMSSVATNEQPIPSEINQSNLVTPYSSPFMSPSLFSSSHHQHQQYETVVNPQSPIPQSNVFQWPMRAHEMVSSPESRFSSLDVPENGVPWKCPQWMANQNIQPGSYMNFNAQQSHHQQQQLRFSVPFKRKATADAEPIQSKQLITEEKMAAHLNGLHISSDFTAHDINQTTNEASDIDSFSSYPPSLQDIEEKLKRAQKITVAEVVKSIQEEPLLPAAIMERFEKPCKALVIWQPPQKITEYIISKAVQEQQNSDDENADNNNVEFTDATNTFDSQMDLDS
ncbi:uncharacterized protein LOC116339496 isoform X2 [Contarinia nasturtii]|uniref:uncharacterized protein LOC116339496 isoform X2 n=1 Tax=Contarinia nasturtii TaxID=265458 RepID=UPI0012D38EA6|nr:uncharacterized protein LOC116339496 isoform X2 [Contarinia nasturtii]